MSEKIFISLACYNEAENIEKLIRRIFSLPLADLSLVVVDDNSPDGTARLVQELQSEFPRLKLIARPRKMGYGSAHLAGFKFALAAGADVVISMDADFSHQPSKIPELVQALNQGNDLAIGSRRVAGGEVVGWNCWRKFCSAGAMFASKLILGIKAKDLTSGFRAYRRRVFDRVDLDKITSEGYSFLEELIYRVERAGLKITEVPISFHDRRLGQSKLSRKEIFKFFGTIFHLKFKELKKFKLNFERTVILVLAVSFFVGLWHAFPMLNVVADEMYFVGGVLRAMENHSLLPAAGDVPYGTLTYFLNYFLIGGQLAILLPFFSFSLSALEDYLVQAPETVYIVPRLASALLALVYLYFISKILRQEVSESGSRAVLLLLLFGNMLTVLILHTGKMWVLSTLLVVISFYFLYQALSRLNKDSFQISKNIFWSIIFGFLAAANFPLNAIFLVNLAVIAWVWRKDTKVLKSALKYSLIGLALLVIISWLNFSGISGQIASIFSQYRPLDEIGAERGLVFKSFSLYFQRLFAFYPLLLAVLLFSLKDGVKNKKLFGLAALYFCVYFATIGFLATWSADNLYSYFRYCYPLGFFLFFIVISFKIRFRKIFYLFGFIAVIYFLLTLYLLSAATSYNLARDWTVANLNYRRNIIINQVNYLYLPKNKKSYQLTKDKFCASKCQKVIASGLNSDFRPLVVDKYTREEKLQFYLGRKAHNIFLITSEREKIRDNIIIASFSGGRPGRGGYGVDGRMANYFDWKMFFVRHLGPDIYILRTK